MKCRAHFRKGGKRNKPLDVVMTWGQTEEHMAWLKSEYGIDLADFEVCDGDLDAVVDAFGGYEGDELDITWHCKKCGWDVHPYLPDEWYMSGFLTVIIDKSEPEFIDEIMSEVRP